MKKVQIRKLRERGGFTLMEWGYLLGVSYVTVWRWEHGKYPPAGASLTLLLLLLRDYKGTINLLRQIRH